MPATRRAFLLAAFVPLAPAVAVAAAAAAEARAFPGVMLGREAPAGLDPRGWLVSEKLDGVRAIWDGSRLWFRSGLPIAAPGWFTNRLPPVALDGELWMGRGRFEETSGAARRAAPDDSQWRALRYEVFDLPGAPGPFRNRAQRLQRVVADVAFPALEALAQEELPDAASLQRRLDAVVRSGGEGLMLHRADALWRPGRSDALLKLKPLHDAEAVVVGHVEGQGRHAGRLGALRVRTPEGVEFMLGTGFDDRQREHPPALGSTVTYTFRGTTEAGVPRFASFLRVREP